MSAGHRSRAWLIASLVMAMMMVLQPSLGSAAPGPGGQGTDTSIPPTDSQTTVNGRGPFANLAITVNQTANLTNQAVSITWVGGAPTRSGPGRFGSRYLQIMQCWGDDDGSVPGHPGPPPEQCVQGAVGGTYGGLPGGLYPSGFALSRLISRSDWPNFDATVGHLDPRTTNVWRPFRAVGGTEVNIQTDPTFNPSVVGGNFWLNPFFNLITTNEIAGAATGSDGGGAELFQVHTGVQSSGLGCGQRVQPVTGGNLKIPQCWIVVVPRGTPADENAGTPFGTAPDQFGVVTSPLSPLAWQHRIAIPIDFNPVDSPCSLAADSRRISGSELALAAVQSWQPSLCASGDLPPYAYGTVGDNAARQQLVSGQPGAPGMVVVSRPLTPEFVDRARPVVYAPISLSGIVIGFNIERNPAPGAPPEALQLAGVRVAELNLTPRLVAKLLTQSYRQAVSIVQTPGYTWLAGNPAHLGLDADFRQFNPEFELLQIADSRTFSGLQLPSGTSDAAQQLWQWVLADAEARAWMNGEPDEWGMRVNPVYATVAAANSTGSAFGDPVPSSFPKADPYCYQGASRGPNNSIVPSLLCGTDWMPYRRSYAEAAQVTRLAADGARINDNPFAASSADVWLREAPQFLGRRSMLALTDTASAAQFGLQTARLSRAGDNGPGREFVMADTAGLTTGVASMAAGGEVTVLEPSPTSSDPGAYPLTALTYAAISPLSLDTQARAEYAAFIDYASTTGQVPGLRSGQLPRGYAPLPEHLRVQAATAATTVRTMVAAPAPTNTPSPVPTAAATPPERPAASTAPQDAPTDPGPSGDPPAPAVDLIPVPIPSRPTSATPRPAGAQQSTNTELQTSTDVTDTAEPSIDTAAQPPVDPGLDPPADPADVPEPSAAAAILTPIVDMAGSRYAVTGLGVVALGSALGALEITKRPRRKLVGDPASTGDPHELELD